MSFPSKFTSFDKSILAKISLLIIEGCESVGIAELISLRLSRFEDISELMLALDILYVLEKIELDEGNGVVNYVK